MEWFYWIPVGVTAVWIIVVQGLVRKLDYHYSKRCRRLDRQVEDLKRELSALRANLDTWDETNDYPQELARGMDR
jgi:hypothetical protein